MRLLDVVLDALPGDSLYKTAVRDSIDDETLVELSKRPREGHGKWSHEALLLADIIDRLGHLGYAMRAYKEPPDPYVRPGIGRRRRGLNAKGRAYLQMLADNHGATERPMTLGRIGQG